MLKHISGNPTVVVENMPGAGGMIAANHVYNVAPKDGTAFATFASGMITNQLIGDASVQYDMQKYNWLGAVTNTTNVCIATESFSPSAVQATSRKLGPTNAFTPS